MRIKSFAPDGSGYSERKVKTYVITISKTFPKTHPRAGELTDFEPAISLGLKLHTIRANYDLWENRFAEIDSGNAVLSVREWTGKPYRSKQKESFEFDSSDGIGLQKLDTIDFERGFAFYRSKEGYLQPVEIELIAGNDGLLLEDFKNWFKGYDLSKPMAIIHFTRFRY